MKRPREAGLRPSVRPQMLFFFAVQFVAVRSHHSKPEDVFFFTFVQEFLL